MKKYRVLSMLFVCSILFGCREKIEAKRSSDAHRPTSVGSGSIAENISHVPMPTIVGRWKAVHGWPETLDLGADGTVRIEASGGKIAGVFSFAFPTLDYDLNYLGSLKRVTYAVAYLSDTDLVIRSALKNMVTGRTFNVYKRLLTGQAEPSVPDLKQYGKLLPGTWARVGGNEVVIFHADGLFLTVDGDRSGLSGIFTQNEDDLQLSANTPKGIWRSQFAIIGLNQDEMQLLSEKNARLVYRRKT